MHLPGGLLFGGKTALKEGHRQGKSFYHENPGCALGVGKFVFLSKVFTWEPLWISYHWAVLLIQIKVMRGKPFSTREC